MTTVIFLGAGASIDAGYPLTANLLAEVKSEFENSIFDNERRDWKQFDKVRRSATGLAKQILFSSNPEIVLTLPDLAELARQNEDREKWASTKRAYLQEKLALAIGIQERWYGGRKRRYLSEIASAKPLLQRLVQSFFLHKNVNDKLDEEAANRRCEYLRRILSGLRNGDSVVTTNWDILAEQSLLSQDKWSPADGYGFSVNLTLGSENPATLDRLYQPSPVRVLKLHGSVGWFRAMSDGETAGELYLRRAQYLEYLSPSWCIERLSDRNEPRPGHGPDRNPVIMFPSFLKQLADPVLRSIWDQAAEALSKATRVYIIGYSLPSADVAVRALLNPLGFRLRKGDIEVVIVNPSEADLGTWRHFVGERANFLKIGAKDFAERSDH